MNSLIILETETGKLYNNCNLLIISNSKFSQLILEQVEHKGHFLLRTSCGLFINTDGICSKIKTFYRLVLVDVKENGLWYNFIDINTLFTLNVKQYNLFKIEKYSFQSRLGIVHWNGKHCPQYAKIESQGNKNTTDVLNIGAITISHLGLKHIKIYIGQKSDEMYHTNYHNKYPKDIAKQDNYKKLFNSKKFNIIVIVCHGYHNTKKHLWKTYDKHKNIQNKDYYDWLEDESTQLYELAKELSNYNYIKFIITNWEGDCIIGDNRKDEVYLGMRDWINFRQKGITNAHANNVKHGLEVNFVNQSVFFDQKSVVTEVVPYVKTDYISYSCYDCKNKHEFNSCIEFINNKSNDTPLIIGEFGSPVNIKTFDETKLYIEGIKDVVEEKCIELCMYWQLYENEFIEHNIPTNPPKCTRLSIVDDININIINDIRKEIIPKGFGVINPEGYANGIWFLSYLT